MARCMMALLLLAATVLTCGRGATRQTLEFSLSAVQVGLAELAGDCEAGGLTLGNVRYAGPVAGRLGGRGEIALTALQVEDECSRGRAAGSWLIEDEGGNVLLGTIETAFAVETSGALPPPWSASGARLRVSGGSGRFASARGEGSCEAEGTVGALVGQRGSLQARCRLILLLR